MKLPSALRMFCLAYVAALGASLGVAAAARHAGLPQTRWDPLSDPLMGDLMEYPGTFQLLHSSAFFDNALPSPLPASMFSAVAYPPFASVLLAPLYTSGHPSMLFLTMAFAWLAVALSQARSSLRRSGLGQTTSLLLPLILFTTSFPVQRLLHQGNLELLVWAFAATGIFFFLRQHFWIAAGLWGLAAAVKVFPLLLLVLLAQRRRYSPFWFGLATFVMSTWLALCWLGPTPAVALMGAIHNVSGYQQLRSAEWSLRELAANHSAFSFVKLGAEITRVPGSRLTVAYYVIALAAFVAAYLCRLARMPVTNRVLGVTVYMLWIPTVSYYHALVHLYAPLFMLLILALRAHRASSKIVGIRTTLLLFIPLLAPYTLCTFPRLFLFCGLIQSAALGLLFLSALQYPFVDVTLADDCEVNAERWQRPALRNPTLALPGTH